MKMQTSFIYINKVPTKVITFGKWIGDDFKADGVKDLVIVIPGNPGFPSFYKEFLEKLHQQLGWPVWIVGHAGHEFPDKDNEEVYNIPPLHENKDLYNLAGQIQHKIDFFEKYVPKNVNIHLIGHSAGAYIITKLLKIDSIKKQHKKSYMMFPTLEFIGDSPNGKWYNYIVKHIVPLILILTWLFTHFPSALQYVLVYIYVLVTGAEVIYTKKICKFLDPRVLGRVFYMATDEMKKLKEREDEVIRENLGDMKFYFGEGDGWAPRSYCDKLKKDFPTANAEMCVENFRHAFVLKNSKEVATMVAEWIKKS